MAISESQLETWSHQGAITTSKNTYASIKGNLETSDAPYAGKDFDIFLQGSYGNDTNIHADSDVDVVILLKSTFHRNLDRLPPDQIHIYQQSFSNTTYHFSNFKQDVKTHLQAKYGFQQVIDSNKAVKIRGSSGRLESDVIVCCQYRDYHWFRGMHDQRYDEGIYFQSSGGQEIVNYPKYHMQYCTEKHQAISGSFKPMVRILKNMRGHLAENGVVGADLAPSYFIEGMLYNVPDNHFDGNLSNTFCNCINWLLKNDRLQFICPNKKHRLFGNSSVQWNDNNCAKFLGALVNLWSGS